MREQFRESQRRHYRSTIAAPQSLKSTQSEPKRRSDLCIDRKWSWIRTEFAWLQDAQWLIFFNGRRIYGGWKCIRQNTWISNSSCNQIDGLLPNQVYWRPCWILRSNNRLLKWIVALAIHVSVSYWWRPTQKQCYRSQGCRAKEPRSYGANRWLRPYESDLWLKLATCSQLLSKRPSLCEEVLLNASTSPERDQR